MADFYKAIDHVLKNEGGYVNDPVDAGGETKYGISKRSYPNINIAMLTEEAAKQIYRRDFWDANNLEQIKDQEVATKLLDMAVNMGASRAAKILQQVLANDFRASVGIDGVIGRLTIKETNRQDGLQVLKYLRGRCIQFYTELAERKPEMQRFLKGWLTRAKQ
jgi:lysozyme family protein